MLIEILTQYSSIILTLFCTIIQLFQNRNLLLVSHMYTLMYKFIIYFLMRTLATLENNKWKLVFYLLLLFRGCSVQDVSSPPRRGLNGTSCIEHPFGIIYIIKAYLCLKRFCHVKNFFYLQEVLNLYDEWIISLSCLWEIFIHKDLMGILSVGRYSC